MLPAVAQYLQAIPSLGQSIIQQKLFPGRSNGGEYADGDNPLLTDTGDANSDGTVNLRDLLLLELYLAQKQQLDNGAQSRCDFDRDGIINTYDVLALQRLLLSS